MNQINEKSFSENVLKSENLVVVDFWAEWCGPCRMIAPVIEELSQEYDDVKFFAVNVDENQNLSAQYSIRNIPAIVFFKNGVIIDKLVGASPKAKIKEKIDSLNQ